MKSKNKVAGVTKITLLDKNGKAKKLFHVNKLWSFFKKHFNLDIKIPYLFGYYSKDSIKLNTITAVGKALIISQLAGTTSAPPTHIALGVGTPGATTLGSESTTNGAARAAATVTIETTTVTGDTLQLYHEFTFSGSLLLTEEGAFNAGSSGVMIASQSFSAIPVVSSDKLQITHKIYIYG